MDEKKARRILGDWINKDNSLDCKGSDHYKYLSWGGGEVCLDDYFTAEELRAMSWWMRNKKVERSGAT